MSRPLGYSFERAEGGRIALLHVARCWTCRGTGTVEQSWAVTCPDGCTFDAHSRPVSCPGRWDSSEFRAVGIPGPCSECGGRGHTGSEAMLAQSEAEALLASLRAALGVG